MEYTIALKAIAFGLTGSNPVSRTCLSRPMTAPITTTDKGVQMVNYGR